MKIYTKTGDQGETGLLGGDRVSKAEPTIDCLGTIDELNASLGYLRTQTVAIGEANLQTELLQLLPVQKRLFEVGAAVADLRRQPTELKLDNAIAELESSIDRLTDQLPPLTSFILPAGTPQAALTHLARSICRRAERSVVLLMQQDRDGANAGPYRENLRQSQVFLNRLSDWLFVLARGLNHFQGQPDEPWP